MQTDISGFSKQYIDAIIKNLIMNGKLSLLRSKILSILQTNLV